MRDGRDWAGMSAFALAVGVSVGWAGTLIIIAGPWDPDPLSDAGANLLSTIGGAMIGAVAAFLGIHIERTGNGSKGTAAEAPLEPLPSPTGLRQQRGREEVDVDD